MSILLLEAVQFRNLNTFSIEPSQRFNVLYGNNGSGKTSFLESIYFLCLARSFRSHQVNHIIHYERPHFSIFGKISGDHACQHSVGIEKSRDGKTRMKLNGESIRSTAELASLLPLQLINPDIFQLLEGGPQYRRQFLDWGVFHVEPSFYPAWKKFQRALKQRNASLKQKHSRRQIESWNHEFVEASEYLESLRKNYYEKLAPLFSVFLGQLITNISGLSFFYQQGWDSQRGLHNVLEASFDRDSMLGYTQHGSHRTDLQIKINGIMAANVLSRGEQKMVACALQLAQGLLLKNELKKVCVYLVDDLAAELDKGKRAALVKALTSLDAQVFLTGVEIGEVSEFFETGETKLFHVEQGDVTICSTKPK